MRFLPPPSHARSCIPPPPLIFAPPIFLTESVKERKGDSGSGSPHAAARPQSQPYRPDKLVRVDPSAQSLEAYLSNPYKAAAVGGAGSWWWGVERGLGGEQRAREAGEAWIGEVE